MKKDKIGILIIAALIILFLIFIRMKVTNPYNYIKDDDAILGNASAKVTIVEFGDYECPYTKQTEPTIKQILELYPNNVNLVFRDFPLPQHVYAKDAAIASECADEQRRFWQYHDKLFENQNNLTRLELIRFAKELRLNEKQFNSCLDSKIYLEVEKDFNDGLYFKVNSTPTFFINQIKISGVVDLNTFKALIDNELSKE